MVQYVNACTRCWSGKTSQSRRFWWDESGPPNPRTKGPKWRDAWEKENVWGNFKRRAGGGDKNKAGSFPLPPPVGRDRGCLFPRKNAGCFFLAPLYIAGNELYVPGIVVQHVRKYTYTSSISPGGHVFFCGETQTKEHSMLFLLLLFFHFQFF